MQTIEGYELDSKVLALLGPEEQPVFAARPSFATARLGQDWDATSLLLTDQRLVISKDRLFKAKADFGVPWTQVEDIQGSLWNGGGPQIQLLVSHGLSSLPLELIVQPQHAVEVESAIRSGYLSNPDHPAHRS